ncbi:Chromate transport protein [Vanrija pseudolonga]|uniref:Chromate transport protein n=1 Tax=Vanrija pseudolonga TaxID=143232 RepID=A0AAF0Y2J5_9TREE|nr:Chromate transport protein [Vanrija pseudolonga]
MPLLSNLAAIARHYYDLGFTSFGGPGVHVVILRQRFVDRLRWVDEKTFVDLFALGNALPGPGSTQLAFSIAVVTHGVVAGLFAFLLWSLPGAIGMGALGFGISHIGDSLPGIMLALFTGLNAASVGLIALAALQLATAACTDKLTTLILWLSASFGICYHAPWMYPSLIATGGLATLVWDFRRTWLRKLGVGKRAEQEEIELAAAAVAASVAASDQASTAPVNQQPVAQAGSDGGGTPRTSSLRQRITDPATPPPDDSAHAEAAQPTLADNLKVVSPPVAVALLLGFVLFLTVPLATRAGIHNAGKHVPRALDFFCNMIIAGTIIFGGGPVVIPLLRGYVVDPGWVSDRDFLLLFAILQAFPGPNFNFAVALGVLALSPKLPALGAVLGFIGIFAPGILLKLALLPIYSSWRDKSVARSVLRGLNAAASGLVFTAVWQLFLVGYIYQSGGGESGKKQALAGPLTSDPFWAVVSSGTFVASRTFGSPPWLSVMGGGVAGLAWYGVQQS